MPVQATTDGESGSELKTLPQMPPRAWVERGDDEFPREMLREARSLVTAGGSFNDSLDDVDANTFVDSENVPVSTALVHDMLVNALFGRERVVTTVGVDVGTIHLESSIGIGESTASGGLSDDAGCAVVAIELFVNFVTGDVIDVMVWTDVVEQPA